MDCQHSIRQGIRSEVSQDDFQGAIRGLQKSYWKGISQEHGVRQGLCARA